MKTVFIFLLALCAGCARDDSDPTGGHSGSTPRTDALTGCQYLTFGAFYGAAITPRIAADGKTHLGCEVPK